MSIRASPHRYSDSFCKSLAQLLFFLFAILTQQGLPEEVENLSAIEQPCCSRVNTGTMGVMGGATISRRKL